MMFTIHFTGSFIMDGTETARIWLIKTKCRKVKNRATVLFFFKGFAGVTTQMNLRHDRTLGAPNRLL